MRDQRHHQHEDEGAPEQGERDVDEPPHRPGAVDLRGLAKVLGDSVEPRAEKHSIVADVRPDGEDDHGDHDHARIPQPVDGRNPEIPQQVVDQAVFGGEHAVAPDQRGADHRRHAGQEEDCAEQSARKIPG